MSAVCRAARSVGEYVGKPTQDICHHPSYDFASGCFQGNRFAIENSGRRCDEGHRRQPLQFEYSQIRLGIPIWRSSMSLSHNYSCAGLSCAWPRGGQRNIHATASWQWSEWRALVRRSLKASADQGVHDASLLVSHSNADAVLVRIPDLLVSLGL